MPPLRALLAGAVDYAGLFPPAALDMRRAVDSYSTYRRGRMAWMLGRFVVPIARLAEFEDAAALSLPRGRGLVPWRLSAISGADLAADLGQVASFNARRTDEPDAVGAVIDALELKAPTPEVITTVARLVSGSRLRVAYEVPLDGSLAATISSVGRVGGVAKVRLGGLTPDEIPSVEAVASWLWIGACAGVPSKATAGLHHPIRGTYPLTYQPGGPRATMHGFLNLLLAACAAHEAAQSSPDRAARPATLEVLLAETSPAAFHVATDGIGWRSSRFDTGAIERARASLALSFGSCSFEEPVDELRSFGFPV